MSSEITYTYQPDYTVPPGEILLETIEERGMTQAALSGRTGRKKKTINEIIKGKAPITPETALQLERVLGTPASFWNNLERNYRADLARLEERERLKTHVEWLKKFPVKEMIKKKWIKLYNDKVDQLQEVLNFFGVASPNQWNDMWNAMSVSFRKSQAYKNEDGALSAWLRQGKKEAQNIDCRPYNKSKFLNGLQEIRSLTVEPLEVFQSEVERLCAEAGVAVVFVPELPKTHVSGVTRWLTPHKALLQLSYRHKTDDHLWFSFFHEAAHILKHGKTEVFIDLDNVGQKEDEANKFAADFLIPAAKFKRFIGNTLPGISKATIKHFAKEINIAPGIVVGRLQHDGVIPQSHCNDLKARF